MPRWGKSVSRRRRLKVGHLCACGCGDKIDAADVADGRAYIKLGHRSEDSNPNWRGERAKLSTGRNRAQRRYLLEPCEVCSSKKAERHHRDFNVNNNSRENIQFLCRRHHMEIDGRRRRGRTAHMAALL